MERKSGRTVGQLGGVERLGRWIEEVEKDGCSLVVVTLNRK